MMFIAGCFLWSLDVLRGPWRYKKKFIVFPYFKKFVFFSPIPSFFFGHKNQGLDPDGKESLDPNTDLFYWIKKTHLD